MGPHALGNLAAELTKLVRRKLIHIGQKIGERHVSSIPLSAVCGNLIGYNVVTIWTKWISLSGGAGRRSFEAAHD